MVRRPLNPPNRQNVEGDIEPFAVRVFPSGSKLKPLRMSPSRVTASDPGQRSGVNIDDAAIAEIVRGHRGLSILLAIMGL
jgi:hypothetical protein